MEKNLDDCCSIQILPITQPFYLCDLFHNQKRKVHATLILKPLKLATSLRQSDKSAQNRLVALHENF